MDSRDHSGSESMRVTPADTEPSTKPGSKPPQRARRSSTPSLVYPLRSERARLDGRDHIQLHAVYFQSTFSPLSVHIQSTFSPRTWIHVDPMAFSVEGGSQGHGGKGRRPPMPPGAGRPDGLPGMAGVRNNLIGGPGSRAYARNRHGSDSPWPNGDRYYQHPRG
jgi:hypothetical protein